MSIIIIREINVNFDFLLLDPPEILGEHSRDGVNEQFMLRHPP